MDSISGISSKFQYPRVDRLVSAGASPARSLSAPGRVSVSSGGSIGVCWNIHAIDASFINLKFQYPRVDRLVSAGLRATLDELRELRFQYPRVDRLVSAGFSRPSPSCWTSKFQYPRVDRLVSAGGRGNGRGKGDGHVSVSSGGSIGVCWGKKRTRNDSVNYVSVSSGGSIGVCWCGARRLTTMPDSVSVSSGGSIGVCWLVIVRPRLDEMTCFSILGWIDWCLLDTPQGLRDLSLIMFQYPRVDRLVSAGRQVAVVRQLRVHVSVSSGGSIGVCWWGIAFTANRRFNLGFQYPRVDRLVSAGYLGQVRLLYYFSFSILGWIDWCLLGGDGGQRVSGHSGRFQYPRVDRLVSAGARFDAYAVGRNWFQYPRVDRLVSAGLCRLRRSVAVALFQYPRVDRLVSAGTEDGFPPAPLHFVSVSSGGSIGVCWELRRVSELQTAYGFSILGWIDWCLLGRPPATVLVRHRRVFQYPRVDRLVSAGHHLVIIAIWWMTCFSILGWIDWCLLG